ncbi:MAG: hypothetical protein F4Z28_06600 [Gammaproteobacteria bacterium]|nr:hypothetical protein [Gammaproteobacteria bacterium]
MADLECWSCGASLDELPRPITRHMNCPECFEDLHCCRMCRNYAPDASITCTDERTDPPVNKENANFCDYFRPTNAYRAGSRERQAGAKAKLDALFGASETTANESQSGDDPDPPGPPDDKQSEARRRLDDLFGP